jgi:glutamyl-Q tRNA(Asp) synthetase
LIAAIASFLDARANEGLWLVRMEDLDPPREPQGASEEILEQLVQLGLKWDGDVLFQSSRLSVYQEVLETLQGRDLCYACDCTRPQVKAMGSIYNGACRTRSTPPTKEFALRVKTDPIDIGFDDLVQGHYQQNIEKEVGDFVIRRKDTLFAYQLAVVVDDYFQQISHIIRGYDLIDSTPRQIFLQQLLNYSTPNYGHVPIIVNEMGQKLSKQRFATPIDASNAAELINQALLFLGQTPPEGNQNASPADQLQWATENWDIQAIPKLANIPRTALE